MPANLIYIGRVLLAMVCGAVIGYERENRNKQAGLKTHVLVALGACVAMIVSKYGFSDVEHFDAARVAAQVISGIGFLGAGVIFVKAHIAIEGLTTAAGLWATSAIAMALGSGMELVGIFATITMVTFQNLSHKAILPIAIMRPREVSLEMSGEDYAEIVSIETKLREMGAHFVYREVREDRHTTGMTVVIVMEIPDYVSLETLMEDVGAHKHLDRFTFKSYIKP